MSNRLKLPDIKKTTVWIFRLSQGKGLKKMVASKGIVCIWWVVDYRGSLVRDSSVLNNAIGFHDHCNRLIRSVFGTLHLPLLM